MARKVLLSFLGNNRYQKCRYTTSTYKSPVVRFFQEALVAMLTANWTKQDQVFIFLTPAAEKNNWDGQFYEGKGLKQALSEPQQATIHAQTAIPSGISETEIWQLFERLYACLEPNDEVYLDITHGFRSLPMLLMVLLDYAKALKNIQVKKIYYGAFETLGPYPKIQENYPNPADRLAPILDLTSFAALQDWTAAAEDFKLYGKFNRLEALTQDSLAPVLPSENGQATTTSVLEKINKEIKILVALLQTNRGKALGLFDFDALQALLTEFSQSENLISPLTAVIQEVQNKVAQFKTNDPLFWLKAARWCRDHGLIQQSITQLREGYITWLCLRFQQTIDAGLFDFTQFKPRVLITNAFTIAHHDYPKSKWFKINKDHTPITRALINDPIIQQSAELFIQLGILRHDINHGGYQQYMAADMFSEKLNAYISQLAAIIDTHLPVPTSNKQKSGLLNISPYPSADWSLGQQALAIQQYGEITDWDFPVISPTLDAKALAALIDQYYRNILSTRPNAVHLIGEMNFTFGLIERLKAAGIPCIASVWNGKNTNDLTDESATQFVQFRTY